MNGILSLPLLLYLISKSGNEIESIGVITRLKDCSSLLESFFGWSCLFPSFDRCYTLGGLFCKSLLPCLSAYLRAL